MLEATEARAFAYDPDKKLFLLGGTITRLADFDLDTATSLEPDSIVDYKKLVDEGHLVMSIMQHPVQLPRMTKWLQGLDEAEGRKIARTAQSAMLDASKLIHKKKPDAEAVRVGFPRPGHVELTTGLGRDLGVWMNGAFREEDWQIGFAEYDFHNVDSPQQATVLLAGLGVLAFLASAEC